MDTPSANIATAKTKKLYACGTLTYTKAALVGVFFWVLWGNFCLVMMMAVVPSVLPLKLKVLACPDWLMGAILSTIPGVLNMTICPYISFKSDRFRSRWGRRIPFIITTLPFLCISLLLLGFSEEIRALLQQWLPSLRAVAPATITIGLIALFLAIYQFFLMYVGSVFWYLFNDVVPRPMIGRFVGMLRIVTTLASMIYSYFIFKFAETHMREICVGSALLYGVGMGLMCLLVKEGGYPPLDGEEQRQSRGLAGLRTFFKESFSHKFYWLIFLSTGMVAFSGSIGTFGIFLSREMGMTLAQIGKLSTVNGAAALGAMYLAAMLVDRWHPMRISAYLGVFGLIATASGWVWIFVTLPGRVFFWFSLAGSLAAFFQSTLGGMAGFPREIRVFPQSRFGQFCSAQAMLRSLCQTVAGILAGLFIDVIRRYCPYPNFAYRFIFIWQLFFGICSVGIFLYVYKLWYRLGGDALFHPPAPWSPEKIERSPILPTIGPQSRWLTVALWTFDALVGISLLGMPLLMAWMRRGQAALAYKWSGNLLLPLAAMTLLYWLWLRRGIRRDMRLARAGQAPVNGIPHHGLLIVVGASSLAALGLWVARVLIAVNLGLDQGALVFNVANVVTTGLLVAILHLMCRIERGHSVTIDVPPALAVLAAPHRH